MKSMLYESGIVTDCSEVRGGWIYVIDHDRLHRLDRALGPWAQWFSNKIEAGGPLSGAEQDLFEAIGCIAVPKK